MKKLVIIGALIALLALALGVAGAMWISAGEVEISLHGLLAMLAGVVLALALGIGLMALLFYSSRRGYDDQAGHWPERVPKRSSRRHWSNR